MTVIDLSLRYVFLKEQSLISLLLHNLKDNSLCYSVLWIQANDFFFKHLLWFLLGLLTCSPTGLKIFAQGFYALFGHRRSMLLFYCTAFIWVLEISYLHCYIFNRQEYIASLSLLLVCRERVKESSLWRPFGLDVAEKVWLVLQFRGLSDCLSTGLVYGHRDAVRWWHI